MKVLAVAPGPGFSVYDVHVGWVEAFRELGCEVRDFNFEARLNVLQKGTEGAGLEPDQVIRMAAEGVGNAAWEMEPDVVFLTYGKFIPPELFTRLRRRSKTVLLLTESPYEDELQLPMAGFADHVLLNDPTNLEAFRQVNPTARFQGHCYRPTVHCPGPADPDLAGDVGFVGSGFPSRVKFLEQANLEGLTVKLAGTWPQHVGDMVHEGRGVSNVDAVKLYRSVKASFNLYRREGVEEGVEHGGWAAGPREIELAATGTFFLRDRRPESDALFPSLPTFDTPQEFGDCLRWWLRRDSARADAARKARQAIAERTFTNAAAELLRNIGV